MDVCIQFVRLVFDVGWTAWQILCQLKDAALMHKTKKDHQANVDRIPVPQHVYGTGSGAKHMPIYELCDGMIRCERICRSKTVGQFWCVQQNDRQCDGNQKTWFLMIDQRQSSDRKKYWCIHECDNGLSTWQRLVFRLTESEMDLNKLWNWGAWSEETILRYL